MLCGTLLALYDSRNGDRDPGPDPGSNLRLGSSLGPPACHLSKDNHIMVGWAAHAFHGEKLSNRVSYPGLQQVEVVSCSKKPKEQDNGGQGH